MRTRKLFQMARRIPAGIERKEAAAGADLEAQIKAIKTEIIDRIGGSADQMKQMQKQLDSLDRLVAGRPGGGVVEQKTAVDILKENDSLARLLSDKSGKAFVRLEGEDARAFQRKTTLTSVGVGYAQTGVMPIQRLPDITAEPRQQLTLRNLLTATPTTFQVVDFVRVLTPMTIASPVPEGSLKPENAVQFTTTSERVKVIATWIPASRQILDDLNGLAAFLQNSLGYYTDLAEEQQLLSGDNIGENLHGIIPQSSAFNQGLLNPTRGWNKIDIVGTAIKQIAAAKELMPTFIVMHPNDWWDIRLTKDGFGRYLISEQQSQAMNLFGLDVDATTNIAQGTFLVGSGNPAAIEIMDRMELTFEISTEHASFFTSNLVACRSEKRLALVTRRPGSFVSGSFSTSPFAP